MISKKRLRPLFLCLAHFYIEAEGEGRKICREHLLVVLRIAISKCCLVAAQPLSAVGLLS